MAIPLRSKFGPAREPEMLIVREFVTNGDTCIDVGASKGTWTYALSSTVGRDGFVLAIEPQERMCDYLLQGFGPKRQVGVLRTALSDSTREGTLRVPRRSGRLVSGHASLEMIQAHDFTSEVVPLRRLDDVVDELSLRPVFIKIDVEGHEYSLIKGAANTIRSCQPTLVVELNDRTPHGNSYECFEELTRLHGYSAALIRGKRLRPVHVWPPRGQTDSHNVVFSRNFPKALLST